MNTLIKIVKDDYNGKRIIFFKKIKNADIDIQLDVSSLSPSTYYGFPVSFVPVAFAPREYKGTLKISQIADTELRNLFLNDIGINQNSNVPYSYKISLYNDIDSYDPDDIELALNIRSVHKSPEPDTEFTQCHTSSVECINGTLISVNIVFFIFY